MPDHVHAIVWFSRTGQLSGFMHAWRRKSSFHIRNWYREEAPNYVTGFGEGERFWQPKYYSFEIFERPKLEEMLTDMHLNPVRAGLTQTATEWKWSSARWYADRRSVGVPIQWVDGRRGGILRLIPFDRWPRMTEPGGTTQEASRETAVAFE